MEGSLSSLPLSLAGSRYAALGSQVSWTFCVFGMLSDQRLGVGETEQKGRTFWDMLAMVMSSGPRTITVVLALAVVLVVLLAGMIGFIHYAAEPGTDISLLYGLIKYKKANKGANTAAASIAAAEEVTGLKFDGWGEAPDGSGCKADIDASKLSVAFRDRFDIALVCGYTSPTDIMKNTHISVSALYTPQNLIHVYGRFSKSMMDFPEDFLPYLSPKPRSGTQVALPVTIWFKAVLLPKNMDIANIQKLSDVIAVGGKLASEWPTGPQLRRSLPSHSRQRDTQFSCSLVFLLVPSVLCCTVVEGLRSSI